jgi:hypothetical protein
MRITTRPASRTTARSLSLSLSLCVSLSLSSGHTNVAFFFFSWHLRMEALGLGSRKTIVPVGAGFRS